MEVPPGKRTLSVTAQARLNRRLRLRERSRSSLYDSSIATTTVSSEESICSATSASCSSSFYEPYDEMDPVISVPHEQPDLDKENACTAHKVNRSPSTSKSQNKDKEIIRKNIKKTRVKAVADKTLQNDSTSATFCDTTAISMHHFCGDFLQYLHKEASDRNCHSNGASDPVLSTICPTASAVDPTMLCPTSRSLSEIIGTRNTTHRNDDNTDTIFQETQKVNVLRKQQCAKKKSEESSETSTEIHANHRAPSSTPKQTRAQLQDENRPMVFYMMGEASELCHSTCHPERARSPSPSPLFQHRPKSPTFVADDCRLDLEDELEDDAHSLYVYSPSVPQHPGMEVALQLSYYDTMD